MALALQESKPGDDGEQGGADGIGDAGAAWTDESADSTGFPVCAPSAL